MNMKIGKKEISLLLGLAGIAIGVLVWFLIASPTMDKTTVLENENATLKVKAEEYEAVNARLPEYTNKIAEFLAEKEEIVEAYPSEIRTEDQIMFWANIDVTDPTNLAFKDLEIESRDPVAVAGIENLDEASLNMDANGDVTLTDEEAIDIQATYKLFSAPTGMNFAATYQGLKTMVDYINSQEDKNAINQIEVAYDAESGLLTGSIWVNLYYIEGLEKEYKPSFIPTVPVGQADVFHTSGFDIESAGENLANRSAANTNNNNNDNNEED